jgi:hypothetical protein
MAQSSDVPDRWGGHRIYLNDLLLQHSSLERALMEAGIPVTDTFGSTSMGRAGPPDFFLLQYGPDCEVERLREIVPLALEAGCKAIDYTSEWASRRKIYLGSYGYQNSSVHVAGPEVVALLDRASNLTEFIEACYQLPIFRE